MKNLVVKLISGIWWSCALGVFGLAMTAEAGETAMKGRYVNLKAQTDCTEVKDVDGHFVCSFEIPSVGIRDDGETYSRIVKGTGDYVKGAGKNQGYTISTFADGSVMAVQWEGVSKFNEDKTRVVSGTYQCTGGAGRFEGIECDGTWTSAVQKGGFTLGEYDGRMTLPD